MDNEANKLIQEYSKETGIELHVLAMFAAKLFELNAQHNLKDMRQQPRES